MSLMSIQFMGKIKINCINIMLHFISNVKKKFNSYMKGKTLNIVIMLTLSHKYLVSFFLMHKPTDTSPS